MSRIEVRGMAKNGNVISFDMTVPEIPHTGDLIITEQPDRRRWLVTQRAFSEEKISVYAREIDDYGL